MVYLILDFAEYTLSNVVCFESKQKLINYIIREYGDYLDNKVYIDWADGQVFSSKESKDNFDEPIAVFEKKSIR